MVEKNIVVHGLCSRCRFYIDGYVSKAILFTEERESYLLHVHFTLTCPMCGRLVNLISVDKPPLKKES